VVTVSTVHDTATVSSSGGTPSGSVTFTLYSGTPGSGTVVASYPANSVNLVLGQASSAESATLAPGNYYFVATYGGSGVFAPVVGAPEPFTIALLTPTLSTNPNVSGTAATDTATVTGSAGTPTGTVTFTLYSGAVGSGTLVSDFGPYTESLVGGVASSPSTGILASGDYYFLVTYSGDSTYAAVTQGTPELFTVVATAASHTTTIKIPTKGAPTGLGGSARHLVNGGFLGLGGLSLFLGLMMMGLMLRRRRQA